MARAETHEPEAPMTREEFLAWEGQRPSGRFERIDGIVVAMAPERASHNLRKGAARDALRRADKRRGTDFLPGLRRRHDRSGRKQRLRARCSPALRTAAAGLTPRKSQTHWCLSKCCPRTAAQRDRATKLRSYFKLPSVQHYLVVWPEEQRIVRHSRMPNDQVTTQVFVSGEIRLDPPGIMVSAEEFYID